MTDRTPTQPGMVQATPMIQNSDGSFSVDPNAQVFFAKIERADAPYELGTPWAKGTVLTDATATALGLDPADDPTPNDAFAEIAATTVHKSGDETIDGIKTFIEDVEIKSDQSIGINFIGNDGAQDARISYAPPVNIIYISFATPTTSGGTSGLRLSPNYLSPRSTSQINLGTAGSVWDNLYVSTAPIIASDAKTKKDISALDRSTVLKLITSVPPVRYRLLDGKSGRYHYGFIAQDVEAAMEDSGVASMDFAGLIKSAAFDDEANEKGEYIYALRYEEFIPILWAHQQDIENRISDIERRLNAAKI